MRSTQKKFLAALEAAITDAGFEPIHNAGWSNTGVVTAEPADGFDAVLRLSYNFQRGYAKFTITNGERFKRDSFSPIANTDGGSGWGHTLPQILDHAKAFLAAAQEVTA